MFIFLGVLVKAVAGVCPSRECVRRGSVPGNMLKSHRDYFEGIDRKGCRQDLCFMHRSGSDKTAREIERTTVATNSTRQEASLRPFKDLAVCGS